MPVQRKNLVSQANHPTATSASEAAALASATRQDGTVDLLAFEAQRHIDRNTQIDGIDAHGIVRDIVESPAWRGADPEDRARPLMEAINARLSDTEKTRFARAIDDSNRFDTIGERAGELFKEKIIEPIGEGIADVAKASDRALSDAMSYAKTYFENHAEQEDNKYLKAGAAYAANAVGNSQLTYGGIKGATGHAIDMVGDVVDLAEMAGRMATDDDYRNLVVGAAKMYAAATIKDPSKPAHDLANAGIEALEKWEADVDKAMRQNKGGEVIGKGLGVAGVEILATLVPETHLAKFGKLARMADVITPDVASNMQAPRAFDYADASAPLNEHRLPSTLEALQRPIDSSVTGSPVQANVDLDSMEAGLGRTSAQRRLAREAGNAAAERAVEFMEDAARHQDAGGLSRRGANQAFDGLAGMYRSQGHLDALVNSARKNGVLDDLLQSGALSARELNHMVRQPNGLNDFNNTSFEKAVSAWANNVGVSKLTKQEIGDIGEAFTARKLVQDGWGEVAPIQNKFGHGLDFVGRDKHGVLKEIEVKSSLNDKAVEPSTDPEEFISSRLEKARGRAGFWKDDNVWDAGTSARARRVIKEVEAEGIQPIFARANITRDPSTGLLSSSPTLQPWVAPAKSRRFGMDNDEVEPSQSLQSARGPYGDPDLDAMHFALLSRDDNALYKAMANIKSSPAGQEIMRQGYEALEQAQARELQSQITIEPEQMVAKQGPTREGPVMTIRMAPPASHPLMNDGNSGDGGGGGD